ncbi:MAG: amidinotransferase [Saprospiraceae bacterium]|nr:amidinotransferase [Saprospiraceae bacterium]
MKNQHCTDTVMMVRPAQFTFNPQTAPNNAFQSSETDLTARMIQEKALKEFENLVDQLTEMGISVYVVEDSNDPPKPDAIFPNNWITTHRNGAIITYPMQAPLRRQERREDIVNDLMHKYGFDRRYSLEHYEEKDQFLEGTGSMVLDRLHKIVYACISIRTDPTVLDKFCALTGYDRVVFNATDKAGQPIYHTNVMMTLGTDFAVLCLECIDNPEERKLVSNHLVNSGRTIIEISEAQMSTFAGNMLQLSGSFDRQLIVMSSQAKNSLTESQKNSLTEYGTLIDAPLDTIEYFGGGSARCMIAEIFTPLSDGDF